ncbi:MAG: hypothetical protein Q8786_02540 [Sweet potato little leaf phytoplasma]|nr:hypothetical protein [Sweet potato little leaf phytoplasma]
MPIHYRAYRPLTLGFSTPKKGKNQFATIRPTYITLCSVHSKHIHANIVNTKIASDIGKIIAQKALAKGIIKIC